MIKEAIESYLSIRRSVGFKLEGPDYLLRSFAGFASQRGESYVLAQTAIDWASQAPTPGQCRRRLHTVIKFARHIRAEEEQHEIPPKGVFGPKPQRRIPFIFTQEHISNLIQEALNLGPPGTLRPQTYANLFALLSVTGLRISEALSLRINDITREGLVIEETKFKKSRFVPLHETTNAGLQHYLCLRKKSGGNDDHVFISFYGSQLAYSTVNQVFRQLIRKIGLDSIHGRCGRSRPQIHDLRHTFAVRALECSPKERDKVGRHLLALSTYLGHAHVYDTYWYLKATPQLTGEIAEMSEIFWGEYGGIQ